MGKFPDKCIIVEGPIGIKYRKSVVMIMDRLTASKLESNYMYIVCFLKGSLQKNEYLVMYTLLSFISV